MCKYLSLSNFEAINYRYVWSEKGIIFNIRSYILYIAKDISLTKCPWWGVCRNGEISYKLGSLPKIHEKATTSPNQRCAACTGT